MYFYCNGTICFLKQWICLYCRIVVGNGRMGILLTIEDGVED